MELDLTNQSSALVRHSDELLLHMYSTARYAAINKELDLTNQWSLREDSRALP